MNKLVNALFGTLALGLTANTMAAPITNWTHQSPAKMMAATLYSPERAPIMASACAGDRVVAVGEYGAVLLLDPGADKSQQADAVPTRAPLTSVSFVDQRHGWAVGHQGVILRTRDGGGNWSLLQADKKTEALFTVHFENEELGFAGGRFATLLKTTNGGQSWQPVNFLSDPEAEEVHLFDIFSDGAGRIYAASEFGQVFVSEDKGATWKVLQTGFGGSLWAGVADAKGTIVTVGMVGAIYRSEDFGANWQKVQIKSRASFTDVVRMPNDDIVVVGLNGVVATSQDNGATFKVAQREDRAGLTSVGCGVDSQPVLFSKNGLVR